MMKIADWLKTNYLSIADWIIAVVAVIAPVVLSRKKNDKIAHKKNSLKAYMAFMIKISFYYFALICIFFWVGNFLHISDSLDWIDKKRYLRGCITFSFIAGLIGAVKWTCREKMLIRGGLNGIAYVLTTVPILLQFIFYMIAVLRKISFPYWAFCWAIVNFTVVFVATFLLDSRDFFNYSEILLYLKNSEEVHAVVPNTICRQGSYIVVDVNANNQVKYPAENIKKLHYLRRNKYRSGAATSITHIILSWFFSFWYFLVIGLVSQFLFRAVIVPISVTENQVVLEKGDYYQIEAVSLNSDSGQLQYTISGDNAIDVSPSGVISVSCELPEGKYVAAEIIIMDETGNSATVQVEVRT